MTTDGSNRCETQVLLNSEALGEREFREARMQHDGRPVWLVLTRQAGAVRGWLNRCPHQGRSLNFAPDRFLTDDQGQLMCAAHGAVFELEQGRCVTGPCLGTSLRAIDVEEKNGQIRGRIRG